MVSGSVVIGVSYFRTVVAGLKGLFGGRISQYEVSIEGARRKALVRMRQAAKERGANAVFNVRLETSALAKQGPQQNTGAVEVFAYGTALYHDRGELDHVEKDGVDKSPVEKDL